MTRVFNYFLIFVLSVLGNNFINCVPENEVHFLPWITPAALNNTIDLQFEAILFDIGYTTTGRQRIDQTLKVEEMQWIEDFMGLTREAFATFYLDTGEWAFINDIDQRCQEGTTRDEFSIFFPQLVSFKLQKADDIFKQYLGPFSYILFFEKNYEKMNSTIVEKNESHNEFSFTYLFDPLISIEFVLFEKENGALQIKRVSISNRLREDHDFQESLRINFFYLAVLEKSPLSRSLPTSHGCGSSAPLNEKEKENISPYTWCMDYKIQKLKNSKEDIFFSKNQIGNVCIAYNPQHKYAYVKTYDTDYDNFSRSLYVDFHTRYVYSFSSSAVRSNGKQLVESDYKPTCFKDILPPKANYSMRNIDFNRIETVFDSFPEMFYIPAGARYLGQKTILNNLVSIYEYQVRFSNSDKAHIDYDYLITYYVSVRPLFTQEALLPFKVVVNRIEIDNKRSVAERYSITTSSYKNSISPEIYERHDLEICDYHLKGEWFLMRIPLSSRIADILKNSNMEMQSLKEKFLNELNITASRLGPIRYFLSDDKLDIRFKIFHPNMLRNMFHINERFSFNYDDLPSYAVDDMDQCMEKCAKQKDCAAFDYKELICRLLLDHSLINKLEINIKELENSMKFEMDNYATYGIRKQVYDLGNRYEKNQIIFHRLLEKVQSKKLYFFISSSLPSYELIKIEVSDVFFSKKYELADDQSSHEFMSDDTDDIISRYHTHSTKQTFTRDQIPGEFVIKKNIFASQCEKLCTNEPKCTWFSYCKSAESDCILLINSDIKESADIITEKNQTCTIYEKSDLSLYSYEGEFNLIKPVHKALISVPMADYNPENYCSRICTQKFNDLKEGKDESFSCTSFTICDEDFEGTALLSNQYSCYLFAPPEDNEKIEKFSSYACSHYKRQELFNYKEYSYEAIDSTEIDFYQMQGRISSAECAKNCEDNDLCNTFEYCLVEEQEMSNLYSCRLFIKTYHHFNIERNQPKCAVYSRENEKKILKELEGSIDKKTSNNLYFLIICAIFSILGILIGFLITQFLAPTLAL